MCHQPLTTRWFNVRQCTSCKHFTESQPTRKPVTNGGLKHITEKPGNPGGRRDVHENTIFHEPEICTEQSHPIQMSSTLSIEQNHDIELITSMMLQAHQAITRE